MYRWVKRLCIVQGVSLQDDCYRILSLSRLLGVHLNQGRTFIRIYQMDLLCYTEFYILLMLILEHINIPEI